MNKKINMILSILLMITLSGCQQSDTSSVSTVPNEDVSIAYSEESTSTSSENVLGESVSPEEEQGDITEIFYLPLVVNSLLDVEIDEIYISQSNSSSWGENLTDTQLTDKVSIELVLPIVDANSLTWDFLFVDTNGNEIVSPKVDFSSVTLAGTSIVFGLNDAGEYIYSFL